LHELTQPLWDWVTATSGGDRRASIADTWSVVQARATRRRAAAVPHPARSRRTAHGRRRRPPPLRPAL